MPRTAENLLNNPDCKKAKEDKEHRKLADGGGLYLEVLKTGTASWRYYYRFGEPKTNKQGKLVKPQKTYTIGNYPEISLANARKLRNEARQMVKEGKDPLVEKRYQTEEIKSDSFQAVAEEWFSENKSGWSESHSSRIRGYLDRDILRPLGQKNISSIKAPDIIAIIKQVRDRGAVDAAKRVHGFIQQIFNYAVVHAYADRNPAKDIDTKLILPKVVKRHYAAITDPVQVGELLRAIEGYQGNLSVRAALRLAPYLFLRPSELVNGEWEEISFDDDTWIVPAKRRKLPTHIKQADRKEDALLVPLCCQAKTILEELHAYTGRGKYLFPSPRTRKRPLSNNALRTALRIMGYQNEDMTTHGFRAMASTLLNELGHPEKLIELQLGHVWGSEVQRAYDRSEGIEKRNVMMQAWGDYLDSLRSGADVMPFKKRA